jgi:hypothetical protein
MTGRTGYTAPTNAQAPEGPAQIEDVYEHFDPLIDGSVANAAALPSTGNFVGRRCHTQDTDTLWICTNAGGSGTWIILANGPTARAVRTSQTVAINGSTFTDLSANANWSTSSPGQVVGFAAYSNGWTVPRTGVYAVSYSCIADGSMVTGLTVNKSTSVADTDLLLPDSSTAVQARAGASAMGQLRLASADVVRLFALGAGSSTVRASQGHFALQWLREA